MILAINRRSTIKFGQIGEYQRLACHIILLVRLLEVQRKHIMLLMLESSYYVK